MFAVIAALLWFCGALAETTDSHKILSQGSSFWLLLGLSSLALHLAFAVPVLLRRGRE
jgi:hypothetical protein